MGIKHRLKKFFGLSVTDEKAWNPSLWRFGYNQTASGENIDEYTALTYSAVWCAVLLYSGTIGSLPLHLFKNNGKSKDFASELPLFKIMYAKPNPYMTSIAFREALVAHALTWGNAYAEIVRNGYGAVTALWPISPNRIVPEMVNGDLVYKILVNNEEIYLSKEKILHVPGLGFDGYTGYSVIKMASGSIGLGKAMETFGASYFGNGTHPGGIVTHPGKLSAPAHKNLKDSLTESYSGLGQSHRLMLLEEGMQFNTIGIPPEDSQFLESRQFQIPEIARWFNLPPHKLKDLTRSSFNNIESEQISFVTDSILPWLIRFEQAYNTQLLTDAEHFKQKLYFKHNVEGLLRGDHASRGAFYREMFNIGAMSINEIRGKEDLNPDPNPLADEKFVPLNMSPLSMIEQILSKKKDEKQEGTKGSEEEHDNETGKIEEIDNKIKKLYKSVMEREVLKEENVSFTKYKERIKGAI